MTAGERPPLPVAAYRAATRLYPRAFRRAYRDDLVALFQQQYRDESPVRVCGRGALDLALTVPHQHLEAHMHRTPDPIVSLVLFAVSLGGVVLAILGGSEPVPVVIGLAVAVVFGGLGVVAWRRSAPVRSGEGALTAAWGKFLVAGPLVLVIGAVQAQLEVGSWYVWILMVLSAIVLTVFGIALGIAELVRHRSRPAAA